VPPNVRVQMVTRASASDTTLAGTPAALPHLTAKCEAAYSRTRAKRNFSKAVILRK
jgi:hypothetical protein